MGSKAAHAPAGAAATQLAATPSDGPTAPMPNHSGKQRCERARRRLGPYGLVAALALLLDQLSKWWAIGALTPVLADAQGKPLPWAASWAAFWSSVHPPAVRSVQVVPNFFDFRYIENPGAAWGFLARTEAAWRTPFLAVVAVASMGVALASLWGSQPNQRALRWGLALLLGGAVGNLIDRLRLGYVIDFIDWHWYQAAAWPTFNVADACISVGAGLLICDFIAQARRRPADPRAHV